MNWPITKLPAPYISFWKKDIMCCFITVVRHPVQAAARINSPDYQNPDAG